jgi:hypothetical protein
MRVHAFSANFSAERSKYMLRCTTRNQIPGLHVLLYRMKSFIHRPFSISVPLADSYSTSIGQSTHVRALDFSAPRHGPHGHPGIDWNPIPGPAAAPCSRCRPVQPSDDRRSLCSSMDRWVASSYHQSRKKCDSSSQQVEATLRFFLCSPILKKCIISYDPDLQKVGCNFRR